MVYFLQTLRDDLVSDDSEPITVRIGVALDQNNNADTGNTELGLAA